MVAPRIASDGKDRAGPHLSLGTLRDEIIDLYLDWREEAATGADAYATWADATADRKGRCFAAYMAAIDREEAAARSFADAVWTGERL